MTLSELIAKLEAVEEGSRELDIDVHVTLAQTIHPEAVYTEGDDVFVADVYEDGLPVCYGLASDNAPHHTTSLDAALPWEVIHRVEYWDRRWQAVAKTGEIGTGRTEPLARRIAALKAKDAST